MGDIDPGQLAVSLVIVLVPMILSLTVHEYAHALSARALGDDTARLLGRLNLNPASHIDPIGTLLVPSAIILMSIGNLAVPFFGWAKPIPVNPLKFTRRITMLRGMMLTAAAGPLANLGLALLFLAILAGLHHGTLLTKLPEPVGIFCNLMVWINLMLAAFNLLPLYPLDGQKVVAGLLGDELGPRFDALTQRLGSLGLLLVIFFGWRYLAQPITTVYWLLSHELFGIPRVTLVALFPAT